MTRNHASLSHSVTHLIRDTQNLTPDELLQVHGIVMNEDRTVYDTVLEVTYNNVGEWANEAVEADYSENFETMLPAGYLDDY